MLSRTFRHDLPIHLILGALAILTFFPFVFLLISSFRSTTEFMHQFWGIPWNPELLNYVDAWSVIGQYMLNSLIVSGVSMIGVLGIASLSAFVFARFDFPGREFLFLAILALLMVPSVLTLVPAFLLVKDLGLMNTYWALILPYIAGGQVFAIFILRSFIAGLPEEIFEAARLDGASNTKVAYFRRDFATTSLGQLMNALALDESGLLVTSTFLKEHGYSIGDSIEIRGLIPESSQSLFFTVVGQLHFFPTAFPHEDETFVANLDYIFTQLGGPMPYYVWLSVAESLERETLITELESIGFRILDLDDVRENIVNDQTEPARMGLFGFFSLGFIVTLMLSLLALGVHAFLLYQQRFIQFGILRAIGLSARKMAVSLAGEQFATIAFGILGGLILGLAVSYLFIPYMQIGYVETDLVPPFITIVAWREVTIVVAILIGASFCITVILTWILSRLRIFQAIKLGETMG